MLRTFIPSTDSEYYFYDIQKEIYYIVSTQKIVQKENNGKFICDNEFEMILASLNSGEMPEEYNGEIVPQNEIDMLLASMNGDDEKK